MADVVTRGLLPSPAAGYVLHTPHPVAEPPPRCLGCGGRLSLTIDAYGNASIDKMNVEAGTFYCQPCILQRCSEDATR